MLNCIFDMDGTLINSEPLWRLTVQECAFSLYGCDVSDNWIQSFTGCTTDVVCQNIQSKFSNLPISVKTLSERITALMEERSPQAELLPGAFEILEYIYQIGGNIAIASSSALSVIDKVIVANHLPVTVRASSYEAVRSKPHPHVFELAAQRLGATPSQCIAWEDSLNGAISAYAAGMKVVVIPENLDRVQEKFSFVSEIHSSLVHSRNWLEHLRC